jgi:hypothetical protein
MLLVGLVFIFIVHTHKADTQTTGLCPVLVQDALERVEQVCSGTGRNQICYGHSVLLAELRPDITDALLSFPGDTTEIYNINRVHLFPMNVDLGQWGVALLRVQANLPNNLPGQNVLFMLFGDVEFAPESSAQLVSTEPAESREPVRAFRLRTGVGAPLCDSAPPDGLLVQTPHGAGRVELTINGVELSLGSTVFFRAQENRYLTVSTVEGAALVHAAGGESIAHAGSEVQVPLDENLQPSAPPMLPQPYDAEALNSLPLAALERPVEVHPPLSPEEVLVIQQTVLDGDTCAFLLETTNAGAHQPPPNCIRSSRATQTARGGNNHVNANSGANGNGNSSDGAQPGNPPPADAGGNGGNCPGNSCNSNGAAGSGGNGNGNENGG